jgi:soluble P-type ATPase
VSFGNGNNDLSMLNSSALGIGIIGNEGMYSKVFNNGDIIVNNIVEGIDLLLNPLRLKATLRT